MLTLDHKPWEHQPGTFPCDHKPRGSVEPIPDCSPSVGSTWKSLPGRLRRARGEASPGCMLVPTAGLLEEEGWGRGTRPGTRVPSGPGRREEPTQPNWTPAVQAAEPNSTDRHAGCDAQKLNPSMFQFPCWFCCSEKEKKRSDFFPLFPFLRTKIKRIMNSRPEHS